MAVQASTAGSEPQASLELEFADKSALEGAWASLPTAGLPVQVYCVANLIGPYGPIPLGLASLPTAGLSNQLEPGCFGVNHFQRASAAWRQAPSSKLSCRGGFKQVNTTQLGTEPSIADDASVFFFGGGRQTLCGV